MRSKRISGHALTGRLKMSVMLLIFALAVSGGSLNAEVFVLCDTPTGTVNIGDTWDATTHTVLGGPFPGRRTAALWVMENCPSEKCDSDGVCFDGQAESAEAEGAGGWVVGELSSVTLGGTPEQPRTPVLSGPTGGPGTGLGPGAADLSPLINTAAAAAKGCNYRAALASADHMVNFDPNHPWLIANHAKIQRLESRQQATERAVWEASSALSAGQLERARDLAASAADSSVSCQADGVSTLLEGIETALRQQRMERNMARSKAASALLPGLVDLARVIGGGQPTMTSSANGGTVQAATTMISGAADPCGFNLEYRDLTTLAPMCMCPGYFFDIRQFRCVRQ